MADRILKSITFPDLPDKYLIPQGDVTKADLENFAENGTVGNAKQLVASIYEEDKTPYNFRTSGGSLDIGDREYLRKIVGGTVAWNQLVLENTSTDSGVTKSFANGKIILNGTPTKASTLIYTDNLKTPSHKILIVSNGWTRTGLYTILRDYTNSINLYSWNPSTPFASKVVSIPSNCNSWRLYFNFTTEADTFDNETFPIQVFDLTQMFGSTIADYIYSLEQATAGAGVAWFKKLFPKDYYAYNAGELISVKTSKHITTGFNQFDKSKAVDNSRFTTTTPSSVSGLSRSDYIRVVPNASYYFKGVTPNNSGYSGVFWFDEDKNYIKADGANASTSTTPANVLATAPSNAYFVGVNFFTTNKDNVNVNLAWDNSRNGEYEPYEAHEYALDDVELRGIPKLDSNNNLYYDGDEYENDGTVTRKYGIVDLGTLNWSYNSSSLLFYTGINDAVKSANTGLHGVCSKYRCVVGYNPTGGINDTTQDKVFSIGSSFVTVGSNLLIRDTAYTDPEQFKTALSGVYLVYELATPTTESADPYQETQIVNDFGTEEFVDTRTIPIPVGHSTDYQANLVAKLEMSPVSPNGNGEYIVKQTSGENEYISLVSSTTIQNIIARLEALEG